jgi:hypothetical protein
MMPGEDFIIVEEFCASHHLEISFIQTLKEHGMLETVIVNRAVCITTDELPKLEQIVRLHRELDINLEGIEVVTNLLQRIEDMQNEIGRLRKRLDFFEEKDKGERGAINDE